MNNVNREYDRVRTTSFGNIIDVIGATTTGASKYQHIIDQFRPEVVFVEEAGQVLESHVAALLVPSVKHLIMIGDHKQLRPSINNHDLSMDNKRTPHRFDESAFERLVKKGVPHETLLLQHRQHPELADLIRPVPYAGLEDSEAARTQRGVVLGMGRGCDRLFWWTHEHEEDRQDDKEATSQSNREEANMAAELAIYLQRQQEEADVVVLTTYLGQLRLIKQLLLNRPRTQIVLNERDEDDLQKLNGDDDDGRGETGKAVQFQLCKQKLRLATVDNFQGEEADYVVLSLVRSNKRNNIGFLRTTNRVTVALSRARRGLYIVGNSTCFDGTSAFWTETIANLRSADRVSATVQVQCQRHPSTLTDVSTALDFRSRCMDGGCSLPCEARLSCGHCCPKQCHPDDREHTIARYLCPKPCVRRCAAEGHTCDGICGQHAERCPPCAAPVIRLFEMCGHECKQQCCDPEECTEVITHRFPCGHEVCNTFPCGYTCALDSYSHTYVHARHA